MRQKLCSGECLNDRGSLTNRFGEKDLARYEKRKDGKLFKRWLQQKEEDLKGANDKCPGCKSIPGARTGLIKKGLTWLWNEFQAWLKGKFSSEKKSDITSETGNSSYGKNGSNEDDEYEDENGFGEEAH